jgi:hypothetical protein
MAGQDREGGAFFANNRKQKESHPDYRGELRLSREVVENLMQQLNSGVMNPMIELSGWKKVSQSSGTVFISLSGKKPYVKEGSAAGGQAPKQWQPQGMGAALGDDIPFAPEWR